MAEQIRDLLIEEEMKDAYLTYAMSVIVSRALPDARDGLKPVHRRILYAMWREGHLSNRKHTKCAGVVGEVLKRYHPHGDAAVYDTLVRLAQPWNMRYPLVDGQGNFGSQDADPPAAYRYTECRLTRIAEELLADIDLDTVDFVPNFDETTKEPVVLPARLPNLLVNGSAGIAVGMATNIPPHNLNEVADAMVSLLDNPQIDVEELLRIIPGPDFPTRGIVCGTAGIRELYTTRKGLLTVRARIEVEEQKGGRTALVVTEIPYQENRARIMESITAGARAGHITGVSEHRDESDRQKAVRIVVEIKKGEDHEITLNQLYKHTPLQTTFGGQLIALVNGRPETLNIKQLLVQHRDHRVEVIRRRTRHLLRKAEERAHILEGLKIALRNIDEVIAVIKASPDTKAAKAALQARFGLSALQTDAILAMRLSTLTGLEQKAIDEEYRGVIESIAYYQELLKNPAMILNLVREDLLDLKKKYGDPRRTQIGPPVEMFAQEDLIPDEDMAVTISHEGYAKRLPLDTYRSQRRGGKGITGADVKEGDFIEHLFVASTHAYLLFFTDRGQVHWLKVYGIPELGRTSRGRALVNLLSLQNGEKVTAVIPVKTFDERFLFLATERGTVKKTPLSAFSRPMRGGIRAIQIEEGDRLIGVILTAGNDEVVLATQEGQLARFHEQGVRPMGRTAYGVRGIRLGEGDRVKSLLVAEKGASLLTVCEKGFGKRTPIEEYRLTRRGAMGVITIKTTLRNGKVVAVRSVSDEDDLMLMTQKGMVVRLHVKDIRVIGRATAGVKLITVEDDLVVAIAAVFEEGVVKS